MSAEGDERDPLNAELERLREENRYLSFLVWKLSLRDLASQHPKYAVWMQRSYVSTRAADFGVDDSKPRGER